MPGAREYAAPVHHLDVDALLLQRRNVDARHALVGGNGERPQLARLDLRGEFAIAADARGDVPAHDRGLRLAAARVGDVVDLGRLDTRPPARSSRPGCDRSRRPSRRPRRPLPGLALNCATRSFSDWIFERARHDDDLIFAGQPRDRRDLRQVDRRLVGDDRADHHHAADHQHVGVALARAHELRETDRAAGAALVVDGDLRDDLVRLQRSLQRAAGLIPAASRRGGDETS